MNRRNFLRFGGIVGIAFLVDPVALFAMHDVYPVMIIHYVGPQSYGQVDIIKNPELVFKPSEAHENK